MLELKKAGQQGATRECSAEQDSRNHGWRQGDAALDDLLEFSRVTTRGTAPSILNTKQILAEVLANLIGRIEESGATITHGVLP